MLYSIQKLIMVCSKVSMLITNGFSLSFQLSSCGAASKIIDEHQFLSVSAGKIPFQQKCCQAAVNLKQVVIRQRAPVYHNKYWVFRNCQLPFLQQDSIEITILINHSGGHLKAPSHIYLSLHRFKKSIVPLLTSVRAC